MVDDSEQTGGSRVTRRRLMRSAGAFLGIGGLVGGSVDEVAAIPGNSPTADGDVGHEFMNIRVQRAANAWERGFRGRADRTLALTDSGTDARHPAVGPWSGVTVEIHDGEPVFYENPGDELETEVREVPTEPVTTHQTERYSGTNVGAGAIGLVDTHGDDHIEAEKFPADLSDERVRIVGNITWEPANPAGPEPSEAELRIFKNGDQIATTGGGLEVNDDNEKTVVANDRVELDAEDTYTYEVVVWRNVASYDVEIEFQELEGTEEREVPVRKEIPNAQAVEANHLPDEGERPQLVAWNNQDASYGDFDAPRDANSHGTHVSGIMSGSGRASKVDQDSDYTRSENVNATLALGQTLTYEVEADSETGVFASAYGRAIELVIEGPNGQELDFSAGASGTSQESYEVFTAETATVHDEGEATYTVHVRPIEGEVVTAGVVEDIAVGAFKYHEDTSGAALVEDGDDDVALHAGVAPGFSIATFTGLSGGLANFADAADVMAETFNVRAVNMSWGYLGGLPLSLVLGDDVSSNVRTLADNGILSVVSAGNDATPASGSDKPASTAETVSVVATGPRDGIAAYSSGGIARENDDEDDVHRKPDVTAPGGVVPDLDDSAMPGDPDSDEEFGDVRRWAGKGGTSMAAPSVTGLSGLVAQAMEEEAPEGIALPEPGEAEREDTLRLKQAILATASESVFTAAPFHRGKAPAYTFGDRDPYEGFGRANYGAAVDAVSRDLLDEDDRDGFETVGLDVPRDEQAAAGYVTVADPGEVDVDLSFSHYSGGNAGGAQGDPHLDLFVYDAQNPDETTGDPTIVARDQGEDGEADVAFSVGPREFENDDLDERVFYVVAKLVNVPGQVNGDDTRVNFELDVDFDPAGFIADGAREDSGSAFTGGQTNRNDLDVEVLNPDGEEVIVRDHVPPEWEVDEEFGDVEATTPSIAGGTHVYFGLEDARSIYEDLTHFAKAPDDLLDTGQYTFGPIAVSRDTGDEETLTSREWVEIAGTERTVTVVGEGT